MTRQERLMELWQDLEAQEQVLVLAQIEGLANPEQFEHVHEETMKALSDPVYRAELALECGGFMPTERGERLMNDPTTRAYFGREIQNDLPALEGRHLLAVALLVANLSTNAEAPSPETD